MTKRLDALRIPKSFGRVMEQVFYRDDQFIVERAGRPMAAIVPVWQLERWERERTAFFEMIAELRARNRRSSAAAIERDVAAAAAAARRPRRRRSPKAPRLARV